MPGQLAAISINVNAIKTAVFTTDSTQLKQFLSAWNVYGRFVENFPKPLSHSVTIYKMLMNWIGGSLGMRLEMPIARWNINWWKLLYWSFCSRTNQTWLTLAHLQMHWELFSLISETTAVWLSGARSATRAERWIWRTKIALNRKEVACSNMGYPFTTPIHLRDII